ncbi:MAG: hypothetical protein ACJ77K_13355 [Bacteroidia bacterium]
MITRETAFIIGAGGSFPYGFPLGEELVRNIIANLSTIKYTSELKDLRFHPSTIQKFGQRLAGSNLRSIDTFLEHQSDDLKLLGKTAIAQELIKYTAYNKDQISDNWYKEIWNKMYTSLDLLKKNKIYFITFNYDLSLEHFLYRSVSSSFDTSREEIVDIMSSFTFIHVHGKIGLAPWEKGYNSDISLSEAAKGIKIISEDVEKSTEFTQAQEILKKAERIYILGFGYHPINIQRLKLAELPHTSKEYIKGNSFGFTQLQSFEIEKLIGRQNILAHSNVWNNTQFIREQVSLS